MSPYLTGCQPWRENPTGFPRFPFRAHTQWYNSLWHCGEDRSWASCQTVPSKHWPIVGSMLGQRLRRWPNIDPTMFVLFAGRSHRSQIWMRTGVLGLTKQNEIFAHCWTNVGPASHTLGQHCINIGCTSLGNPTGTVISWPTDQFICFLGADSISHCRTKTISKSQKYI